MNKENRGKIIKVEAYAQKKREGWVILRSGYFLSWKFPFIHKGFVSFLQELNPIVQKSK